MESIIFRTNNKWISTVASIWIQCTSGSLYTFSIYSAALKSTQSYDQSTLDIVSVFKDFGANAGLLSGILYSSVASNSPSTTRPCCFSAGPWVVLAAGALQSFAGYFLMWLSIAGLIPRPPIPLMCLFMLLAAHGQTFFNTADVVTAVHNFPNFSGTVVGIMKGFLGLSGAILIQVYQTVFKNKPSSYLLMLSLLPTFNSMFFMCFVRIFDVNEANEKKHLNGFSVAALMIAAYLMALIIFENTVALNSLARVFLFAFLIILLASPIIIAIKAQHKEPLRTSLLEENQVIDDLDEAYTRTLQRVDCGSSQIGQNVNLYQAISTIDFWLLFIATACCMGSGLATVNNISQIGGSLGYTNKETSALVSLWSIWNFLGRFGTGYVSDYFLHTKRFARPLFMAITLATMSIGHLAIASSLPGTLYAGSVLVGVCYGSQWSLMPTIASEIFGVEHFGTIFNTITIASPIGSYVFSVRIVGYIYDKEASGEGSTCTGSQCFMLSFFIMAGATSFGFLVALALFLRTRMFYKLVIVRRLQLSAIS